MFDAVGNAYTALSTGELGTSFPTFTFTLFLLLYEDFKTDIIINYSTSIYLPAIDWFGPDSDILQVLS